MELGYGGSQLVNSNNNKATDNTPARLFPSLEWELIAKPSAKKKQDNKNDNNEEFETSQDRAMTESGIWIRQGEDVEEEFIIDKPGYYRLDLSLPLQQMQQSKTYQVFKAHEWIRTLGGDSRFTVMVDVYVGNEYQTILKKEIKLNLPEHLEEALQVEEDDDTPLTAHYTKVNFEVPSGFLPCRMHLKIQSFTFIKRINVQAVLFRTGIKAVKSLGDIGKELFKHGMNRDVRKILLHNDELKGGKISSAFIEKPTNDIDAIIHYLQQNNPPILPYACMHGVWTEVFSIPKHGANINKFFEIADQYQACQQLLIAKLPTGEYVGGFSSNNGFSFGRSSTAYGGNGESFVFYYNPTPTEKAKESEFNAYKWTQRNNYFVYTSKSTGIAMGGPKWALFIDSSLLNGTSEPSDTYGNTEPIVKSPFQCEDVILLMYESFSRRKQN